MADGPAVCVTEMSDRLAPRQNGYVRDARRRRVPAVTLRALAADDDQRDQRRRKVVKLIRARTRQAMWQALSANAVTFIVAAYLIGKWEDRLIGRHAFQGPWRAVAILGILTLIGTIAWWSVSRATGWRRARLAVEAGFCGSCGYDLSGLHPQEDGLQVCPECGSAWRQPPSDTSAPE